MKIYLLGGIKQLLLCLFCSCYGQVTSLNGEAEQGIIVEALGEGETCSLYQEESKTDQEGYYRIRGLQVRVTQSKGRTTYFQTHCRIYVVAAEPLLLTVLYLF